MQKENSSSVALTADAAPLYSIRNNPLFSPNASPRANYLKSDASLYSSLSPKFPTDSESLYGGDAERRFRDSSSILEYQQLYNRYTLCLSRLRESIENVDALRRENEALRREKEALRRENEALRLSNADISGRLALPLNCKINRLCVASSPTAAPVPVHVAAPQPLTECNHFERRNPERTALPKSISVLSKGYLNIQKTVTRPSTPSIVYVQGAKEEEDALEFDVYNQGMFKTELCNRWEETGACPYDDCQFAHGIKELRPVIRHPRYKTEVCRTVLAGVACPYGHRCHFRHSLTED